MPGMIFFVSGETDCVINTEVSLISLGCQTAGEQSRPRTFRSGGFSWLLACSNSEGVVDRSPHDS